MDKVYAPVMITTICRYEKFKRCVESLSQCTDADKTELFIGVDYPANESHWEGYNKIRDYLPTISGFKKVNIFMREENWGQGKNVRDLLNRMKEKYDRYIDTEDDNEFSPNFLQYMNQCLERYKNDDRIGRICGYSYIEWENMGDYPYNAFPMEGFCAWGIGCWFNKEENYASFLNAKDIIFNKTLVKRLFSEKQHVTIHRLLYRWNKSSADLRYRCYCALEKKCCIFPSVSKVRNNGFDGDGLNCAVINTYATQVIDVDANFCLDDIQIMSNRQIDKMHDKQYAGNLVQRLLIKLEYCQWKHTGKAFRDMNLIRFLISQKVKYFLND